MKIEILTTGDELLEGVICDQNASYLAQELYLLGLSVQRISTVGDTLEGLSAVIKQISTRSDLCIITGGLGPTSDDITLDALAHANGGGLEVDDELWGDIQARYASRGKIPPSNRRQARVPVGGEPLRSEVGTAPGMKLSVGGCLFIAYPGVPSELKWHAQQSLLPLLESRDASAIRRLSWRVGALGESALQERLNHISSALSKVPDLRVGYQALGAEVRLKFTSRDAKGLEGIKPLLRSALGEHLISEDDEALERVLLSALLERGQTMGCAESCTGGGVAARMTRLPGVSSVFLGGVVAYSNEVKRALLGVSTETLIAHGAVSAECAREMAMGAREALGVDWALSVTGVAGPGGGTELKPVGTVFFAWAGPNGVSSEGKLWSGDRALIQSRSIYFALYRLLREVLEGSKNG